MKLVGVLMAGAGLTSVLALANCGPGSNFNPPPNAINENTAVSDDVKKFREDAVALARRPELDLDEITIQYVLIATGVDGSGPTKPSLSINDAEELAADVYKQAQAGSDFDKLALTHSYGRLVSGQRPGMFTLLRGLGPDAKLNGGPNTFRREQEEDSVSRAAWRLQPGEVGAVERHERDSNSGFYIVRRLTEAEIAADDPANVDPANEAVKSMREEGATLMQRPEHDAKRVKVQHILIGRYFSGSKGSMKRLSPQEAEELAAQVYARARSEEDFSALVREYTYDSAEGDLPGSYFMFAERANTPPGEASRDGMVQAFGDVSWRLNVGEVGVTLYSRRSSFFGYHIIKRIE